MKITSFEVELSKSLPPIETNTKVTKYKPPREVKTKGRKYEAKDRQVYGPFLEDLFYKNELLAYEKKAKTNAQLKYEFLDKYKRNYQLRNRFKNYKETIGNLRSKYNRRTLYSQQAPVYIISLQYNEINNIVVDGNRYYQLLSFEEAYERCLEFKVADPRFVPPEYIEKIRDRQNSEDPLWRDWSVPSARWIRSFENKIGCEAYNSVYFPVGWTREDTPND